MCFHKALGVKQSYEQAFSWFQLASIGGVINARCMLGKYYIEGLHVSQDLQRGIDLLKEAARYGDRDAPILATAFLEFPVPIEPAEAAKWLERSDANHEVNSEFSWFTD